MPGQTQLMEALAQLGFRFKSADVEKGRLRGATLPFFQEIEFHPGPEYRGKFNELEVTFIGGPQETKVIFEADQKGTWFSEGNDATSWFSIPSHGGHDLVGVVQQQLHSLGSAAAGSSGYRHSPIGPVPDQRVGQPWRTRW